MGVQQINDAVLKAPLQPAGQVGGATQPRQADQAQQPDSAQAIRDLYLRDGFDGSGLRAQQARLLQPELAQQPTAAQQAEQAQQASQAQQAPQAQQVVRPDEAARLQPQTLAAAQLASQVHMVAGAAEGARLTQPRRATEAPPVLRGSRPAQSGSASHSTRPSQTGSGRAMGQARDGSGLQQLARFGRFTGRDPEPMSDQDYANRMVRLSFAC